MCCSLTITRMLFFFFFQAEDGIRDVAVTGVQTCALPISLLVLFAAVRSVGVALVLLALAGCAMIVTTALANTMLQTLVPNELRGRVMAFYAFVFVGMAPLGAFQAGLVAEHTGAPFAIALGGIA